MKKIAKILLPLALCFVLLAGCGQKVEWANPEDYQDHPYQELSLGELADPERIVLAKNGREKSVFEKGSDEYEHLTTMIQVADRHGAGQKRTDRGTGPEAGPDDVLYEAGRGNVPDL